MKQILVLYHDNCPDGFGAAWAAWKKFGARAEYVGVEHSGPKLAAARVRGREVYFLDFSYEMSAMRKLARAARSLIVIDHHESRETVVRSLPGSVYYVKHSGAVLAWRYFHPKRPVPKLLRYVEDIDLWKFKLPRTDELGAALSLHPREFRGWNRLVSDFENPRKLRRYIAEGEIIVRHRDMMVERILKDAQKVRFGGKKALAVNSPTLVSYLGNAMVKRGYPLGIIWSRKGDMVIISLRSGGKVNVAKLAERYGGGGHVRAAGFSVKSKKFLPWE